MPIDPKTIPDADWQALLEAWRPHSRPVSRPQRFYVTIAPVEPLAAERSFDAEEGLLAVYKGKTDDGEAWKAFLRREGDEHLTIRIELGDLPRWAVYEVECGVGQPETPSFTEEHAKAGDLWISLNQPWSVRSRPRKDASELEASPRFLRAVAARIAEQFAGECGGQALRARRADVGYRIVGLDHLRDAALEASADLEIRKGDLSKALKRLPASLKHLRGKPAEELGARIERFVDGPLGVLAMIPSFDGHSVAVRPTKRPSEVPNVGRIVLGWNAEEVAVTKDGRMSEVSFAGCSSEAGRKALAEAASRFVKESPGCFQRAAIEDLAAKVVKAQAAFDTVDGRLRKESAELGRSIERLAETRDAVEDIPGACEVAIPALPERGTATIESRMLW